MAGQFNVNGSVMLHSYGYSQNQDTSVITQYIDFHLLPSSSVYPRFIVFPAPFGFSSVNRAQFSSLTLFVSAFSSPSLVPSISASRPSCSEDVGAAADAGLIKILLIDAV